MRTNIYICRSCGNSIVTVDLVEGVTPFMIGCRAHPDDAKALTNEDGLDIEQLRKIKLHCNGNMYSSFYRVPPNAPKPTWEWYKPEGDDYLKLSEVTRVDHVDRGGLLIRPMRQK